jgi:hypothetical protein
LGSSPVPGRLPVSYAGESLLQRRVERNWDELATTPEEELTFHPTLNELLYAVWGMRHAAPEQSALRLALNMENPRWRLGKNSCRAESAGIGPS